MMLGNFANRLEGLKGQKGVRIAVRQVQGLSSFTLVTEIVSVGADFLEGMREGRSGTCIVPFTNIAFVEVSGETEGD